MPTDPDWSGAQWFHCPACDREVDDPFASLWGGCWKGRCECGAYLEKPEPRTRPGADRLGREVVCSACHEAVPTDDFPGHWQRHVRDYRSRFGESPDSPQDVIDAQHGQPPAGQATLGGVAGD